jgi:hypothetical protein
MAWIISLVMDMTRRIVGQDGAYDALKDPDTDSLLDAANILSSQVAQHGQFPPWLETVFGSLYQEVRHPAVLEAPEDSEREETLWLGRLRRSDYLVERSRSSSPSDDSNPICHGDRWSRHL